MDINFINKSKRIKILLLIITTTLIVLMFPKGESLDSEVAVNSIWIKDDLIASQTFEVLKDPIVYQKEKEQAAARVFPVFIKNNDVEKEVLRRLEESKNNFSEYVNLKSKYPDSAITQKFNYLSKKTINTFTKIYNNYYGNDASFNRVYSIIISEIKKIYRRGYINIGYKNIPGDTIAIRDGKFEVAKLKESFYDSNILKTYLNQHLSGSFKGNTEIKEAVLEYLFSILKPNIIYSIAATEEARKIAAEKVPKILGIINENERIVAKHDRITPEIKAKIDSYRIAKGDTLTTLDKVLQYLGKFLHILLLILPLIIYIYLFRKKIYDDNLKLLLLATIILFVSSSAFIIGQIEIERSLELLILVPVASMLITIVFDSRIGFYSTVIVALIVAGIRGNDYVLAATNIVAGGLAAYTVRDIKNRNQIFRSFLYILLGYVLSILAFGFERLDSWNTLFVSTAYAASNALVSPALTFGLIIFVEKIFGITTELTLFELTDFNSPLLKSLANNAPGTFAHSMTIGSMVENAAMAIGASPILARVGAYYHDIGKTINPEGFIENQLDNVNVHDSLTPAESVKIIREHVIKGIELAKEHKLPQEIIDFIPMHHGTMIINFFYEKAKELYGEENVNPNDYRYPGPKPNTRETALLMLADAAESAVRAMIDPTPEKIENIINNLIKMRIEDGQLDESPLTFNDIHIIKETFLNILISQHHKRIRYPQQEEMENNSDESPDGNDSA